MSPRLAHIRPMLADDRKHRPFSHPDWLFEPKHDGYRMLAEFGAGAVHLRTRQGLDCTRWFPEVGRALSEYEDGPYLVDGEVCVLDELGRSDFNRLQVRARRRRQYPGSDAVTFCMFDLLHAGDGSLLDAPVVLRKDPLVRLFTPKPQHTLLVVDSIAEVGLDLYAAAVQLQLEGLVAKRCDSPYVPGERCDLWKKLKRPGAIPPERFAHGRTAPR